MQARFQSLFHSRTQSKWPPSLYALGLVWALSPDQCLRVTALSKVALKLRSPSSTHRGRAPLFGRAAAPPQRKLFPNTAARNFSAESYIFADARCGGTWSNPSTKLAQLSIQA